jgi:drug/metabolite transporter (DMT)-like permease
VFFRCAAGFLAILPFVLTMNRSELAVKRPIPVFLRCLLSTLGFFAGFFAFAHLPIADAQAISFSRTLFITIFAVWILKERVAWRRWTAVGVGFVGVLMMLRPQGGTLDFAALMAVLSALLFGLTIVTVKDLTRDHSTLALVFYTNAFTTFAGLPFAFGQWETPSVLHLFFFVAMGLAGVGAQSCYVRALSSGEASLMGLVDYIRLPLAIALGLIVFHEQPDTLTLAGAGVIIMSTLYITWRESVLQRPLSDPDTAPPP